MHGLSGQDRWNSKITDLSMTRYEAYGEMLGSTGFRKLEKGEVCREFEVKEKIELRPFGMNEKLMSEIQCLGDEKRRGIEFGLFLNQFDQGIEDDEDEANNDQDLNFDFEPQPRNNKDGSFVGRNEPVKQFNIESPKRQEVMDMRMNRTSSVIVTNTSNPPGADNIDNVFSRVDDMIKATSQSSQEPRSALFKPAPRMSVVERPSDDIFDLFSDSVEPQNNEKRTEQTVDVSLELLNIDFTQTDAPKSAEPQNVIKVDNPPPAKTQSNVFDFDSAHQNKPVGTKAASLDEFDFNAPNVAKKRSTVKQTRIDDFDFDAPKKQPRAAAAEDFSFDNVKKETKPAAVTKVDDFDFTSGNAQPKHAQKVDDIFEFDQSSPSKKLMPPKPVSSNRQKPLEEEVKSGLPEPRHSIDTDRSRYSVTLQGEPLAKDDDSVVDNLFDDFGPPASTPASTTNNDQQQQLQRKIHDKREAIELMSFKVSMIFLEKILILLKNNQISQGKCMGHIGVELAGQIDPQDGENVTLNANFSEATDVWNDSQKLKKNANPSVKQASSYSMINPDLSVYSVNDFNSNILLYEYQLNPKEIRIIPLSVQYRTAIIDGMLKIKVFCHVNPKLPKRLFDIELFATFKERQKLTLNQKQSKPIAIQANDEIKFTLAGLEPNEKFLFEFEFLITEPLADVNNPIDNIKICCKCSDYLSSNLHCNLDLRSTEFSTIDPIPCNVSKRLLIQYTIS